MRTRFSILALLCFCALVSGGCERATSTPQPDRSAANNSLGKSKAYEQPVRVAELEDRAVRESSGVVASRRNPGLFWTHNDSGDGPVLYAFDLKGKSKGRWRVANAQAVDWEDIAAGPGPQAGVSYLYVGDIGDNGGERDYVTVYRIVEPSITADDDSTGGSKQTTEPAEAIRLKYPDGAHDAETLMVHPQTGDLYIITKYLKSSSAGIYKLKAPFSTSSVNKLVKIGDISVPGLLGGTITGGDIAPNGRKVVLCDYFGAYEMSLPASSANDFDSIWKQQLSIIDLGQRQQGEAVCYSLDSNAIFATSEKRPTPLIRVSSKQ